MKSKVMFNSVEQSSVAPGDEHDSELKGPVVRTRASHLLKCSSCSLFKWNLCSTPRLTDVVLGAIKRGWFTTPGRWDLRMKDRRCFSHVFTAGNLSEHYSAVFMLPLALARKMNFDIQVFTVRGEKPTTQSVCYNRKPLLLWGLLIFH